MVPGYIVVGCKFSEKIIYPDTFGANPDSQDSVYSTENGIYQPHCGLDNVMLSWGHDEVSFSSLWNWRWHLTNLRSTFIMSSRTKVLSLLKVSLWSDTTASTHGIERVHTPTLPTKRMNRFSPPCRPSIPTIYTVKPTHHAIPSNFARTMKAW